MKRFLQRWITVWLCFFIGGGLPARAERPPNIVLILSDDHRWDCLGAAGNTKLRTLASYDLRADPLERPNLAGTAAGDAIRQALAPALESWMRRTNDPARQWPR